MKCNCNASRNTNLCKWSFVCAEGSLWGEISQMEDKIVVEYGTFDELFAKDTTVMSKEAKNLGEKQYKKAPTEVRL